MRLSIIKLAQEWAQTYLPGMESEEEVGKARFQGQTDLELRQQQQQHDDAYKKEQKRIHEYNRHQQIMRSPRAFFGEPFFFGEPLKPLELSELKPTSDVKTLHPSKFPDLDINTIGVMFYTKEEGAVYKKRMEDNIKAKDHLSPKDHADLTSQIESMFEGPKSLFGDTKEEALKEYNEFKEAYSEYYKIYSNINSVIGEVADVGQMREQLRKLPLKNFMIAIVDLMINEIKRSLLRIFSDIGESRNIRMFAGNPDYPQGTKLRQSDARAAAEFLRQGIKEYETGLKIIKNLDVEVRKHIWDWLDKPGRQKTLKGVSSVVKDKIVDRIIYNTEKSGTLGWSEREGFHKWIKYLSEELGGIADVHEQLSQKITGPVEEDQRNTIRYFDNIYSTLYRAIVPDEADKIQNEINKAVEMWPAHNPSAPGGGPSPPDPNETEKLNTAFSNLKETLSKYVDLGQIERAFNFGVFSKGKITPELKLAFKAQIIHQLRGNKFSDSMATHSRPTSHSFRSLLGKYTPDEIKKRTTTIIKDKFVIPDIIKSIPFVVLSDIERTTITWGAWFYRELEASGTSLNGIAMAHNRFGDISPKTVINNFVEQAAKIGLPADTARQFAKLAMRQGKYKWLISEGEKVYPPYAILFHMLNRKGQLSPEKMMVGVERLTERSDEIVYTINRIRNSFPPGIRNPEEVLSAGIRSLDTLKTDVDNLWTIISSVHNNANKIQPSTLKKLLAHKNVVFTQSRDIAKKFNDLIIKIIGDGGARSFKKKYDRIIKVATERNIVKPDFSKRLDQVARIFLDNKEINPSRPDFQEVKRLVLDTAADVDLIKKYQTFAKHYDTAKPKDKNIFKLDMDVGPNMRFRVLKDLDPYHFQVGNDTDCCQSPGGVGQEAMIDSFINPLAGVLVLETQKEGDWSTVAQSYFHYVPKDQGYILDNIEVNPAFEDDDFVVAGDVRFNIETLYAYWAQEKSQELQLPNDEEGKGYILAGMGYSDIDTGSFRKSSMDSDPREFSVDSPYTDWEADKSMNLTEATFDIPDPQLQRTASMFDTIYKLAVEFQDNLKEYLAQNPQQYQTMQGIEEGSFEKYRDIYDFDQDAEDIEDDFDQPGAMGVGVTDTDGTMAGYVYGYNMTADEMPDIDFNMSNQQLAQQYGIKFYAQTPEGFARQIYQLMGQGKVFYVSNLALPKYKIKLARMIRDLLNKLRQAGYQYITFDALSDTMKLFLSDGAVPKAARMAMFGVELVAMIPDEGGWEHAQAILKI